MARPALVLGIITLCGSFLLFYNTLVSLAAVFIGISAYIIFFFHGRKSLIKCSILFIFIVLFIVRTSLLLLSVDNNSKKLDADKLHIEGVITSVVSRTEAYEGFTVKVKGGEADGLTVLLSSPVNEYYFIQGDRITADVTFTYMDEDLRPSYYSDGIYYFGKTDKIKLHTRQSISVYRLSALLGEKIKKAVYNNVSGNEADVLVALIMGDRSNISDILYDSVKNSGVSHMLVVSGMHLGIICGAILNLLR